jgi:hypothetical protein
MDYGEVGLDFRLGMFGGGFVGWVGFVAEALWDGLAESGDGRGLEGGAAGWSFGVDWGKRDLLLVVGDPVEQLV